MSLTAIVWLCAFAAFAMLAFRRPSWGIALYLLVFYVDPNFWWWGRPISAAFGQHLSITAALIFAAAALLRGPRLRPQEKRLFFVLIIYALSATIVHFALAANPERSARGLDLLWKNIGLLFLIITSIRDRVDWKIFIYAIVIGSLYIGYEMVVNDRGSFSAGRYERRVAAGVTDANYLAGLLSLAVPLAGALLLIGEKRERLLAMVTLPLVCDTIVLCDSRGGFLALLAGGAWLLIAASGRMRRYALTGLFLGMLAVPVLVRDPRIIDRFLTTFAPAEERDASAQSRLDLWMAGMRMLGDYPLGSGAEAAFKSDRGSRYIGQNRAIHNGYLDVACAWGIQGAALYVLALWLAWRRLRKATRNVSEHEGGQRMAFWGACVQAAFVTQLVSALFISSFDGEWFFWMIGLILGYNRLCGPESLSVPTVDHAHASASRGCPWTPARRPWGTVPVRPQTSDG